MILRFLIDASLPRATADLFAPHAHEAVDVRDVGLRHAEDSDVAGYARSHELPLISADFDFADIRVYPPSDYLGLVIIDRPEDSTVAEVLTLIERFLEHRELVANLTGRLVI